VGGANERFRRVTVDDRIMPPAVVKVATIIIIVIFKTGR
jgi:hypothetical protein